MSEIEKIGWLDQNFSKVWSSEPKRKKDSSFRFVELKKRLEEVSDENELLMSSYHLQFQNVKRMETEIIDLKKRLKEKQDEVSRYKSVIELTSVSPFEREDSSKDLRIISKNETPLFLKEEKNPPNESGQESSDNFSTPKFSFELDKTMNLSSYRFPIHFKNTLDGEPIQPLKSNSFTKIEKNNTRSKNINRLQERRKSKSFRKLRIQTTKTTSKKKKKNSNPKKKKTMIKQLFKQKRKQDCLSCLQSKACVRSFVRDMEKKYQTVYYLVEKGMNNNNNNDNFSTPSSITTNTTFKEKEEELIFPRIEITPYTPEAPEDDEDNRKKETSLFKSFLSRIGPQKKRKKSIISSSPSSFSSNDDDDIFISSKRQQQTIEKSCCCLNSSRKKKNSDEKFLQERITELEKGLSTFLIPLELKISELKSSFGIL